RPVAAARRPSSMAEIEVLASDSEYARGEWHELAGEGFSVRPVGSIAFKLALVAAGLAAATWTLRTKCEWDVAVDAATVHAASGEVRGRDGQPLLLNRPNPRLAGLAAWSAGAAPWLGPFVGRLLER